MGLIETAGLPKVSDDMSAPVVFINDCRQEVTNLSKDANMRRSKVGDRIKGRVFRQLSNLIAPLKLSSDL